jgi:uncharacterized membrane protein YkvA (DUF1232 family)
MKAPDEDYIKQGASKITEADFADVLRKKEDIKKKFESHGQLGRFIEDAKLLLSLVSDYWNKRYREIPYWAICAIVFALLYVLSPVDLIPDFIPVIGLVDDAVIVALCLSMIEQELKQYKEWKIKNG